jgi:hypothetical protein
VYANDRVVNIPDVAFQILDERSELLWHGIAHRVRNIHCSSARLDRSFYDPGQKFRFSARGVLGREFDVLDQRPRVSDSLPRQSNDFLGGFFQLVIPVNF